MSRIARVSLVFASISAFVAIYSAISNSASKNNVCSVLGDYMSLGTSENCWFDPDVNSNATQIISNNGYNSEMHEVTTEDGHILTLFRISNKNKNTNTKGPVFLQHGLTASSISFLGLGKNSLPFLLSEAGYDVWLGNARGTIYSLKHAKYSAAKDVEFWDHSFHEMGIYDLPAAFKYIKKINPKKIIYLGYSVATAEGLIYSTTFPKEAQENLKLFIFMSPVFQNGQAKGFSFDTLPWLIKKLSGMLPAGFLDLKFDPITGKFGRMELPLLPMWLQVKIIGPVMRCTGLGDVATMKPEAFPKIISHNGHGASMKALLHLFEHPKEFRMFNYTSEENMKRYGQNQPPKYNVALNPIPVAMFYSLGDEMAGSNDVQELFKSQPKKLQHSIHKVSLPEFSHLDFIYGATVKEEVYDPILKILKDLKEPQATS